MCFSSNYLPAEQSPNMRWCWEAPGSLLSAGRESDRLELLDNVLEVGNAITSLHQPYLVFTLLACVLFVSGCRPPLILCAVAATLIIPLGPIRMITQVIHALTTPRFPMIFPCPLTVFALSIPSGRIYFPLRPPCMAETATCCVF